MCLELSNKTKAPLNEYTTLGNLLHEISPEGTSFAVNKVLTPDRQLVRLDRTGDKTRAEKKAPR